MTKLLVKGGFGGYCRDLKCGIAICLSDSVLEYNFGTLFHSVGEGPMSQFKYLFQPIKMRSVEIPNRIMTEAHTTNFTTNHVIDERYIAYQRERAKGGVGLIVAELQSVHPNSMSFGACSYGLDERVIPQFKKLSQTVHQYGTKLFCQLWHGGRQAESEATNRELWCPSPLPCSVWREMPKEMEIEDIEEVIKNFGIVARNLIEGGVDGVTLHGGHGYLICQFLSPFSNKRTDEYGGKLRNRTRFLLEIIDEIRRVNGDDFPLGVRISADEFVEGGLKLGETTQLARILEETGKVDFISVSCANYSTRYMSVPNSDWPPAFLEPLGAQVRESTNLPVALVGRINDPVLAERILADGHADLVAMVRAHIADPELPKKAREGRLDDIRPCVACVQGCVGRLGKKLPITCVHNPAAGRERQLGPESIKPGKKAKKVFVVGGGPAGMKYAEIASMRGHKVTLFEKESDLGGQVRLASKMPRRSEWGNIANHLISRMNKLDVDVRLNEEATAEKILQGSPDVVVIAAGSRPLLPNIPGVDGNRIFTVEEVLKEEKWDLMGSSALIYDRWDGHYKAAALADHLSDQGKKVTFVTPLEYAGANMEAQNLLPLLKRFYEKGLHIMPFTDLSEIKEGKVIVRHVYSREKQEIEGIDSVILCFLNRANDELYFELKGKIRELYRVGDSLAPRRVISAILEAHQAAMQT
jgi:mycofactocin system FadH/OYE family oxidoreductase 2